MGTCYGKCVYRKRKIKRKKKRSRDRKEALEAIQKLEASRAVYTKKHAHVSKKLRKTGVKATKRKRQLQKQKKYSNAIDNLEQIEHSLHMILENSNLHQVLGEGIEVMKRIGKTITIDDIENLGDEMAENIKEHADIDSAMSEMIKSTIDLVGDEDEIESSYEDILKEWPIIPNVSLINEEEEEEYVKVKDKKTGKGKNKKRVKEEKILLISAAE